MSLQRVTLEVLRHASAVSMLIKRFFAPHVITEKTACGDVQPCIRNAWLLRLKRALRSVTDERITGYCVFVFVLLLFGTSKWAFDID